MSDFSYAIIGTGALGGYYGSRLAHGGRTVRFLVRGDYDHIRQHGIRSESMHGDVDLPEADAYHDPREMPACDVVVVALKTTQNAVLPDIIPHMIKPEGVVLVLQNGLNPEHDAAKIVGAENVVGGLCFLCSNRVGPGHFRQTRFDHVLIGEYAERGVTARLTAIAEDFTTGGVRTVVSEDLGLARWKKLVWNIPYNGLSAVLDVDTEVLMRHSESASLIEALMREVADAAHAVGGHSIDDAFIETMLGNTRKMGPYLPSMQIDRRLRRAMEVESIFGEPLRRAEAAGCQVPRIKTLYQQLRLLDDSRESQ